MVENLSAYIAWQLPAHEATWAETEFLNALSQRTKPTKFVANRCSYGRSDRRGNGGADFRPRG